MSDGVTVAANPREAAAAVLEKIEIGGIVYRIPDTPLVVRTRSAALYGALCGGAIGGAIGMALMMIFAL